MFLRSEKAMLWHRIWSRISAGRSAMVMVGLDISSFAIVISSIDDMSVHDISLCFRWRFEIGDRDIAPLPSILEMDATGVVYEVSDRPIVATY